MIMMADEFGVRKVLQEAKVGSNSLQHVKKGPWDVKSHSQHSHVPMTKRKVALPRGRETKPQ
jgi:hypothetical protein